MKKKNVSKILFLQTIFVAFSCVVASCSKKAADNTPILNPKYLLEGTYATSNTYFDFYLLDDLDISGNPQYAISLKDKIGQIKKTEYTSDISINSTTCEGLNVTGIWHNAFHNCPAANITIDMPITTIDFEAFLYSGITSITIPWSIQEIGDGAFYACSNLQKVNFVSDGNATGASATTCSTCTNNSCTGDLCTGENGSSSSNPSSSAPSVSSAPAVSSSVETSSSSASGGSSQSSKKCTLKTIPSFCFFKCNSMTELVLPSSLEEIQEEAFNGCYSLETTIVFQNIRYIRKRAFQGCSSLRKIYISSSMFELKGTKRGIIEAHAFNYCDTDLNIRFCATQTNINNWLSYKENNVEMNRKWGLREDRSNLAFSYVRDDADLHFTSDWSYKMAANGDITITKYNGPAPTGGFITIPDKLPNPDGYSGENKVVRLDIDIFDSNVKSSLERLYLPTTLTAIDHLMFRYGYDNLYVIDSNCDCFTDYNSNSITGRIDLSGLTNLKFIGIRAFAGVGGDATSRARIKVLHLPSHLLAIGDEAFGIFPQRMLPGIEELIWDYESDSCLQCVGADAFYGVGASGDGEIEGNSERLPNTRPSTIIFPKTFKYFGILSNTANDNINNDVKRYKDNYNFDFTKIKNETGTKVAKPAHAFSGCSLLGKVIFKGGENSENLVIPLQTFVYNENLHTIVFEERPGKYIAFHTQSRNSHWGQESIGGNSGRGRNDFRGGPFLHTLVLPNKQTTLYIQDFAFHANSRAAIYLSDSLGTNMYTDKGGGSDNWIDLKFSTNAVAIDHATDGARQWKTIGNEEWYPSKNRAQYYGYNFAAKATTRSDSDKSLNTFSIEQETPVYENVYYKDPDVAGVEVGSGNTKVFKIKDKCSFICEKNAQDQYVATMTNYLYDLYDGSADLTTAKVPETVTVGETDYTVTKIGDSAFSACFCDRTDSVDNAKVTDDGDLNHVILPNTIESIGEYAFIRAYGIQKISSYSDDDDPVEGMPSSLRHIGKNAFLFSGIKQVLRIPNKCLFYESENNTTKITSVFANALSLRKITFIDTDDANAQESTESPYYKTTTYTSNREGGPKFTTALYSKNYTDAQNVTTYNKNKLMLILNRDYADRTVASNIVSPATKSDAKAIGAGNTAGVEFDGLYSIDGTSDQAPFLFGAYKMGVWIKELICGNPTTYVENGETKTYAQPLFSAVGQTLDNELIDRYFYLGANADNSQNSNLNKIAGNNIRYENLTVLVETISGKILSLPQYAMNGCEKLKRVEFENQVGGEIPDGVFANVTNTSTNYVTEGPNGETAKVLDLRSTGYSKVGKESFKSNKAINVFIAPDVENFTIDTSAFDSCSNLTTIDLSAVTGTLTINSLAFNNCTALTSIIWPESPNAVVNIAGTEVFKACTALTQVSLPVDMSNGATQHKLADSTFSGCTKLATVTVNGEESLLTSIGTSAFSGCTALTSFEFEKFTSLTTIGSSAFYNTNKLTSDGVVTLPETVTSIGGSAFYGSKLLVVNVTSDSISLGAAAFKASKLTAIRFENHDCAWQSYNSGVFDSCTSLSELQLPTGFNINNSSYDSNNNIFFVSGDTNGNIYLYEKFTSSTTLSNDWRSTLANNQNLLSTHFYVESVNDLLTAGIISKTQSGGTVNNRSTLFWTTDENNNAIKLGHVTDFTGTVVSFEHGQTLIANALNSTLITSVQDLLTANAISDNPASVINTSTIYCISTGNGQLALGNIVSYDGTTVVFSYGYALSGTTLYRLANTVQDMLNSGYVSNGNGGTVEDDTTLFYGVDSDGNTELLGNISDYDGTTITFDNGTLVADVINAIEVENINSLRTGNYITDDGDNHTFNSNSVFYFVDSNDDVIILGKITSYDGTNVVFSNGYVLTTDGLHYQVSSVQDLLDSGVVSNGQSPTVSDNQKHFYMIDSNDNIIVLGTVSSYNGYTVTFSSGKTLTLDMFDAIYVDDLTDVSSAGAITDNPSPGVSDSNKVFFTTKNGEVIVLGTVSSYNGTYVAFSNGCILNSDGIHYPVSSVQDLLDAGVISKGNTNTVVDGTTLFYRNNNGTITFLGHVASFDGNTVTFSEDDHTLTLDVFDAIRIEDLAGLRTGGYISDANDTHTVVDNTSTFCYVDAKGNSVILGTISSYDGTNVVFSNGYVLNTTGFHKLAINVAGLVSSGAIGTNTYGAAIYDRTTSYYMVKNGQIIVLGTITSYDGTTVKFSSGYTLKNGNFTAPANS